MSETTNKPEITSVLVVENDQVMQRLVLNYLTDIGVKNIDCCENGKEALQNLKDNRYDLMVCDWKLKSPATSEIYELLRKSKSFQRLPLLFLAGTLTKNDLDIASKDPFCSFILKPFSEEVFFAALQSATKVKIKKSKKTKSSLNSSGLKEKESSNDIRVSGLNGDKNDSLDLHVLKGSRSSLDLRHDKNNHLKSKAESAKEDSVEGSVSNDARASYEVNQTDELKSTFLTADLHSKDEGSIDLKVQRDNEINDAAMNFERPSRIDPSIEHTKKSEEISRRIADKIKKGVIATKPPRSAAIVDSDASITALVRNYLNNLGADGVDTFSDGKEAWHALDSGSYDMVVMDWNLRSLNGLGLYNRIRSARKFERTPLVVMSGSVNRENFRILEESVATHFIQKPFVEKLFKDAVVETVEAISFQSRISDILREELKDFLTDSDTVLAFVKGVAHITEKPLDVILEVSQLLIIRELFETAELVLKEALKIDKNCIQAITELAKVYHLLDRSKDALILLNHANKFSPGNIERLCLMGEVGLSMNDTQDAQEYFNEVLNIDDENTKAKAGLLLARNIEDHGLLPEGRGPMHRRLASTMNVVGVTYVKNKDYQKGIDQYQAAMCFVSDPETLAKLQFNLGMAYLRSGDKKEAINWFQNSAKSGGPSYSKPQEQLNKLGAISEELSYSKQKMVSQGEEISYDWSRKKS